MPPSILDTHYELLNDIGLIYDSGLYTDLQIQCGSRTFNVHKIIVSARSPVLRQACADNRWKEGKEGVIVISDEQSSDGSDPCNDPVAVEHMIHYMYRGDYELRQDTSDQSGLQSKACTSPSAKGDSNDHDADNEEDGDREDEDEDEDEDDGDSEEIEDEDDDHNSDESSDQDDKKSSVEPSKETKQLSMSIGVLNLHAKIYVLGDKYFMPTLMTRAAQKFEDAGAALLWDDDAFCDAVTTIYNHTRTQHKVLRDVIVKMLTAHGRREQLSDRLKTHIAATPELALGLWESCSQPRLPYCKKCNGLATVRACTYPIKRPRCERYYMSCKCSNAVMSWCQACNGGLPRNRESWVGSQNVGSPTTEDVKDYSWR